MDHKILDGFFYDVVCYAEEVFDDVNVTSCEDGSFEVRLFKLGDSATSWESFKDVVADALCFDDVDEIIDLINNIIYDGDVMIENVAIRSPFFARMDYVDYIDNERLALVVMGYVFKRRRDELADYLGDIYADSWCDFVAYFFGDAKIYD